MNKKKFSFIDLSDDEYIENEIVNIKEENNAKLVKKENKNNKLINNIKKEKINVDVNNLNINENKIPIDFIKEKEKLDIKTNIYLKRNNYIKIEELYKKTGNSRSSIINKLIEIAFKKIEEN